jgi:hypothetical protein
MTFRKSKFWSLLLAHLFFLAALGIHPVPTADATVYTVAVTPKFKAFEPGTGNPLASGKLYTYLPGTTTLTNTYKDYAGATVNTNPVILDANGECDLFYNGYLKLSLYDASNVLVWTKDNIPYGPFPRYYSSAAFTDNLTLYSADLITRGPWVDVRAFGTIDNAVTQIGSAKRRLIITNAQTVTDNLTVPTNIAVVIDGGSLAISAGATLTVSYLFGQGADNSVITKTGAGYAIKAPTGSNGTNYYGFRLTGDATAGGGIDWTDWVTIGTVDSIYIHGFLGTGAIGFNNYRGERTLLRNVYIYDCYTDLMLDTNTSFHMIGGGLRTSTNHAIDTAGAYAQGIFSLVDIAGNEGQITIEASNTAGATISTLTFNEHTGFESNGGTSANSKLINFTGAGRLVVENCIFSNPTSTVTGVYYDIYTNARNAIINNNHFTQSAIPITYTRAFIGSFSDTSSITRSGNMFLSPNVTVDNLVTYFSIDPTYTPVQSITNDIVVGSGNSKITLSQSVPLDSSMASVGMDNTDEKTMSSTVIYPGGGTMGLRGGAKISAAGTKTGTAGSKTIKLHFGATSFTVINATDNNANDWRVQAEIFNTAYNAQRISWIAYDGVTVTQGYETAAIDTTANVTVKMTGQVANATDNVTQTMWLVEKMY